MKRHQPVGDDGCSHEGLAVRQIQHTQLRARLRRTVDEMSRMNVKRRRSDDESKTRLRRQGRVNRLSA
eukprot:5139139-Pleurochrysis_carterae.AAC.3